MSEFDFEPIRGLPAKLPAGERILWQGAPHWWAMARSAFHVRKLAVYCAILAIWRFVADLSDGLGLAVAVGSVLWLIPFAMAALGLPLLFGWLYARSTVYTITNQRVVMRYGVALPMTVNLPFRRIDSAALKVGRNGMGDLPLQLMGRDRIAYLHLWPNARPWRFRRPEPMLRAIPEAKRVGALLADALCAYHGQAKPAGESAVVGVTERGRPARQAAARPLEPAAA
jgi:hypothetical protein